MDFVLKTLSVEQAAKSAVDALVVLVDDGFKPVEGGALTVWLSAVMGGGDLEEGVGKLVHGSRLAGVKAPRVCAVRCGDGSASALRKARKRSKAMMLPAPSQMLLTGISR